MQVLRKEQLPMVQDVLPAHSAPETTGGTGAPVAAIVADAVRVAPGKVRAWLLENGVSMLLWVISLCCLLAFWYFGTKYRWDFYIRFTNVPTPSEVLQKVFEVNKSGKFLLNIGISVRRILIGFS